MHRFPSALILKPLLDTLEHLPCSASPLARDNGILEAIKESAVLGLSIPKEFGGAGGGAGDTNRAVLEVAYHNASVGLILYHHFVVARLIINHGTVQQRDHYLPKLASGWLAAAASAEPPSTGPSARETVGRQQADGSWILDGFKPMTSGIGLASVYLTLARTTEPSEDGADQASAYTYFLVPSDTPGLEFGRYADICGLRGTATSPLSLGCCPLSAESMLGPAGSALPIMAMIAENGETFGAVATGIAKAMADIIISDLAAKGRLRHQALLHEIIGMATQIEAAEALLHRAGTRSSTNPARTTLRCKLFCTSVCQQIAAKAVTLLGSNSYARTHPINDLLQDARAMSLIGPPDFDCRERLGNDLLDSLEPGAGS